MIASEELAEGTPRRGDALCDSLTGLPDRLLLVDRLAMAIAQAERGGSNVAAVALDLGRIKEIEATVGFIASDDLVALVGEHLQQFVRKADTLAYLGGDFFVIVMPTVNGIAQVLALTERLLKIFDGPFEFAGTSVVLTPGLGVALYPDDGRSVESLLAAAVGAAFRASSGDRGLPHVPNPRLQEEVLRRLTLERELRHAIEHKEFVLHYQPQVEPRSGRISGLEALVRWEHPSRGLLAPGEFIEPAEQCGLITAIGTWVLDEACRQLALWRSEGRTLERVAVNVAAAQLREDLVPRVGETLERHGLDAASLELEITETGAFVDRQLTESVMAALKELGVRLTLDDFGTGYSSGLALTSLPFDTLKVDRGFVAACEPGSKERAVITHIIGLAHDVGLTVVAEGVETHEQLDFLVALGCDEIQGFYFYRPLPALGCGQLLEQATALRR